MPEDNNVGLSVSLLGPFRVHLHGREVSLSSRRLRALLTALALRAGHVVLVDSLVEQVWDAELPERPRSSLQTLANRLRASTGPDAVRTTTDGYQLDVPPDSVDVLRFQRLLEAARGAEPATARERLATALALWRGDPITGTGSDLLEREVGPALLEQVLTALEWRADLDLAAGVVTGLVVELQELAARYPTRESLWVRLMAALHRSGRPAAALDAYHAIRTRLADDMGTDPSADLQRLYAQILSGDDPAPAPTAAGMEIPAGGPIPRQLPPGPRVFVGREADIAALDAALESAPPVVAVHGPGGVGKTTLAVRWAHQIANRFGDGQIFINMRGYESGPPMPPETALDMVLRALGVPPARIPPRLDERSAQLRTELAGRRVLLVLDNARDAEQVRPLIVDAPSLVLVTSRSELRGLDVREGASRWAVRQLPSDESVELIRTITGAGRADAEPDALHELADLCARLPLTLVIAAHRAARLPDSPLADLVGELRYDERDRLDLLGDPTDPAGDARTVFSWSYRALDPASARAFRLLGLHPGAQIGLAAAAALLGLPVRSARQLLDGLVAVHLLDHPARDRYRMHDLLRVYAAELADGEETDPERRAAVDGMLDWYVHTLHRARAAMFVYRSLDLAPPRDPVSPLEFPSYNQAATWYHGWRETLVAVVEYAAAHGRDRETWQLSDLLRPFQDITRHVDDMVRTTRLGVAAAERLDEQARIHVAINECIALYWCGQAETALVRLERPLAAAERLGDLDLVALVLDTMGRCAVKDPPTAIEFHRRALELARRGKWPGRVASVLLNLGAAETRADLIDTATENTREALERLRDIGNEYYQALALSNLSWLAIERDDHAAALRYASRALELLGQLGDLSVATLALTNKGRALAMAGHVDEARHTLHRVLAIYLQARDPREAEIRELLTDLARPADSYTVDSSGSLKPR